MMDEFQKYVLVLQCVSILSVSTSVLAGLNGLFLHLLQRNQDFTYHSISYAVMFICLGDSIANASYMTQYRPSSRSIDCTIEGMVQLYGYSLTCLWTLFIAFTMYSMAVRERVPSRFSRYCVAGFGVPFLITFIQSFLGYARSNKESYDICIYDTSHSSSIIFHDTSFWGLLLLCLLLMIAMLWHLWYLQLMGDPRVSTKLFTLSKNMLQYYPILLILCWFPRAMVLVFGPISLNEVPSWLSLLSICLKIAHGLFVGSVYFICGDEARKHFWWSINPHMWYVVLTKKEGDLDLFVLSMKVEGEEVDLTALLLASAANSSLVEGNDKLMDRDDVREDLYEL